ncbi:MAG TPA: hypothetical protein VI636_02395 [Candidatus Angelobacter sp.]
MSNQESYRVLGRMGARELSEEEEKQVQGGIRTTTKCSAPTPTDPHPDGDHGECGGL